MDKTRPHLVFSKNPARRAAERFHASRFLHGYAKRKAMWDPAYAAAASMLRGSSLPLLDIGCGIGLLAAYLRECGCSQPITGIEPDAGKVRAGRELVASYYQNLDFHIGDVRSLPEFSGDIVVLDVLHYMAPAELEAAMESLSARIAPGGRAIIRTAFRDSSWRYFATLAEEAFVRASGWIRGGRCHFHSRQEIEKLFVSPSFSLDVRPMWGKTPFNSHLIEVRRLQSKCVSSCE
ncbi:MAG: methyltransferase domain-containing protein [Verrucomicrobiae bacterium]